MPTPTIPRTGAKEWAAEQGAPWVEVNLALRMMAAYANGLIVESRTLSSPPASCDDGDCFMVGAVPTGLWGTYAQGDIAVALGTNASNGWGLIPKAEFERAGIKIYIVDEDLSLKWAGSWLPGVELFIDASGGSDGQVPKYDLSNNIFYLANDETTPQHPYEAGPPTAPTSSDLATWDNQGTSSLTDATETMILRPQVDGVPHGRYKAAPSTPYDIYCRVEQHWESTAGITTSLIGSAGILFKDTGGDNERLSVGIYAERVSGDEDMLYAIVLGRWSGASPPVFSSNPIVKYTTHPWKWIRVNNDGTTLTVYASPNGKPGTWETIGTETLAAYIDAAASFGIFAYANVNCSAAAAFFTYFSTVAPS